MLKNQNSLQVYNSRHRDDKITCSSSRILAPLIMWQSKLATIGVFICFLLCFLFVTGLEAQVVLERSITFKVDQMPLPDVLRKLSQDYEVPLAYSDSFFKNTEALTLDFEDIPIQDLLSTLLKDTGLAFRYQNEQIVLYRQKRKEPKEIRYTVNGFVSDENTGEKLIGVHLYNKSYGKWTTTNEYGFYSISLPAGQTTLHFSYLGCEENIQKLVLHESTRMDISLKSSITLSEVIVLPKVDSSQLQSILQNGQLMPPRYTAIAPGLGGEVDVVQLAATLPGVQSAADGFGGLYVRGGEAGQNLMLLDGVPVYNPGHLLGIFSVYNSDAIRSAHLLKGSFPARYGGRVSSVFDVRSKEGNQ
ncbi:MAG TPA: hypothetical protein ENJ45_04485, partial [Phaeodactylibacter sp.]|nr:hypothetical protein [Phaeodactylibacter sp.]